MSQRSNPPVGTHGALRWANRGQVRRAEPCHACLRPRLALALAPLARLDGEMHPPKPADLRQPLARAVGVPVGR
eukprot:15485571-Alexandrium_andersonii.AAC.1